MTTLQEYRRRLEAVMIAKCPRKAALKSKRKDGDRESSLPRFELTPWIYIDGREREGSFELVFRVPVGYAAGDLEKQSDALFAACGAPVEVKDYAGAVIVKVLPEDFPEVIPYEESFFDCLQDKDELLLAFDRQGKPLIHHLKVPHMMIAGMSGYGKTDLERWILFQLIHRYTPKECEIWIVDLKGFSFMPFKDIPHIPSGKIVRDLAGAKLLLEQAVKVMEDRSREVWNSGDRSKAKSFKRLFVVIDEAYMISPSVVSKADKELALACDAAAAKISGTGREARVGLMYCTQRPDATIINPLVKQNMDCTLCFKTKSETNSMIVLDRPGAERLPQGRPGRLLYSRDGLIEAQVPYIGEDDAWSVLLDPFKGEREDESEGQNIDGTPGSAYDDDDASGPVLSKEWQPVETGERSFDSIGEGETYRGKASGNREGESMAPVLTWTFPPPSV